MVKVEKRPPLGGNKALPSSTNAPSKQGSTQKMAAHVKVVVRVRPINQKEIEHNNRIVVEVVDDKMLVFDPKEESRPFFYHGVKQPSKNTLRRGNKDLRFVFDHVCGQNASNADVFETTTKDIIASLMEGYNCSVFVYGATGAGKTFTMIGNIENPGITYLTMEHLFYTISSFEKEREFDIAVSYIEVYNENVYDLLNPSSTPLQLREDSNYGVMVAGLTLNNIKTARELLNMLENGNKRRTQHPTDANAESSRSHAVFQVYVKMRYKTSSQVRIVKLSMIDLAGSERASATGCVGERFKEGANINKSLLSLGNCINKLAEGSTFIPYRDSKLTRLLKDSLGGNCKTVMIANVSPSALSYEDTYNTLKYATRANKIQMTIKKNIVDGNMRLSQYVKTIEELQKKIKELEAASCLPDAAKEKAKATWRKRIVDEERGLCEVENRVLALMTQQRVLALRHRLRTRAHERVADLAHRSSAEAIQVCTEEIPRQERAVENYVKQSVILDTKISTSWKKWNELHRKLSVMCNEAASECPDLADFVKVIQVQSDVRRLKALNELRLKLLNIEDEEITAVMEYTSEMPTMLKKLYLTLKGYDKVPPALTEEYLEIMRKAKAARGITWSDKEKENCDSLYKFISTLDLDHPTLTMDYDRRQDINVTIDLDSDDLESENIEPVLAKKRKGTPIKLVNNDTIIINDSLESLDTTRNITSAKKLKREDDRMMGVENCGPIDPKDLNSTFVLPGAMKMKKIKVEVPPLKRGLADRTNIPPRTLNFDNKAKIVKPVARAVPFKRTGAAFGSSVPRDGAPLPRNIQDAQKVAATERSVGFKAMRARERLQAHPYTRPAARR
ncbi:kinesin-like protein KIF18A isoform X2 [Aricia agestis]|uniref:kinesin-like protein KIF18A isoform X2 n=1 Tax=Aricia agestis TaxID=91739 RepID=UPI001C20BE84|nr:kinesin-like protein KIF18A isoform X2 [Aricia agestis]